MAMQKFQEYVTTTERHGTTTFQWKLYAKYQFCKGEYTTHSITGLLSW